ncbi:MAG: 5-formyltetrahydrofolate cyclo-ligase [Propionibacteriaceae bacterium]|nr:5-formyltetrahydrofolate cyclo-ligase [Propionibacteriaceae bacterium]
MMKPRSKASLRVDVLMQRGALSMEDWAAEDAARTSHLLHALGHQPGTVALYTSRRGEPGTVDAITLLHGSGWQVLLPTVDGVPGWAVFDGWDGMRPAWGGILQPTTPHLGGEALSGADAVVVACLAVARDGTRLGTGGGWYDRALTSRRRGAPVWALARTPEVVDELPREPHDVAVDKVITPDGVHTCGEAALGGIGRPWPPELS